ncbi:lysophospholipid acyltransferase family protein [Granulicella tundricola]|uniref:DUF374 domain-containing protein n=1 Tax=Granulicella tundricola (strain ATCC BAA-1859 / DSM 23138 / MP5ACTX9) TaxID=1198114 RepID=E8X0D5_GRATM|nr:lysophospholipid acyltransferase family protein [Granulicella tundricola]ADW67799.1 protein of unknown function DUF374 [Granulicella tundricola MP5ACTX9]
MSYSRSQRVVLAVAPFVAAWVIRALGATLRYEDVAAPGVPPGGTIPGAKVYAFWHRSLLACAYYFRGQKIAILISRSFDGEIIARTVERLGFIAIRGSSTRGGSTALRQMVEHFKNGHQCAITADGPKGPPMIAKPGIVQVAELVDASYIGAFYALPKRAWVLKTWDSFVIPKPFSRVALTWPPLVMRSGEETLEELQVGVQAAMDEAVRLAEAWKAAD